MSALTYRGLHHRRAALATLSVKPFWSILPAAASLRSSLRHLVRRKKSLSPRTYDTTSRLYGSARKLSTARLVVDALPSKQIVQLQRLFTYPRYRQWQAARSTRQALLQQQLGNAAAVPLYATTGLSKSPVAAARFVLQRKGHSAGYYARTARALRNRLISGEVRLVLPSKVLFGSDGTRPQTGLFRVARKVSRKYKTRTYGFLDKTQQTSTQPRTLYASAQARSALDRENLYYRELKFYHNRPRLRLPELAITRSRKRKAGLTTFTRNSLEYTRSPLGQARTLLPPANLYSSAVVKQAPAFSPTAATLMSYVRRDDLLPVFWKRAHSRANIRAVNRVRRRRYGKRKRFLKKRNEVRRFRLKVPLAAIGKRVVLHAADFRTLAQQKANSSIALRSRTVVPQNAALGTAVVKFLPRVRRNRARKIQAAKTGLTLARRTVWHKCPKVARLSRTLQLKASKSEAQKRIHAL